MAKVTKHGSIRIKERIGNTRDNTLLRVVSYKGKSKNEYKGSLFQYLLVKEKQKNAIIKLYKNNVYVLSKNSRRLITTYPLPSKYLPTINFELNNRERIIISFISRNLNHCFTIRTNKEEFVGYISFVVDRPRYLILIEDANNSVILDVNNIVFIFSSACAEELNLNDI